MALIILNILHKNNRHPNGYRYLWCERRDLNPYESPHTPLKRARLPIPPLSLTTIDSITDESLNVNTYFNFFLEFQKFLLVNSLYNPGGIPTGFQQNEIPRLLLYFCSQGFLLIQYLLSCPLSICIHQRI